MNYWSSSLTKTEKEEIENGRLITDTNLMRTGLSMRLFKNVNIIGSPTNQILTQSDIIPSGTENSTANFALISEINSNEQKCVPWKNIYLATKKRIYYVVANKRDINDDITLDDSGDCGIFVYTSDNRNIVGYLYKLINPVDIKQNTKYSIGVDISFNSIYYNDENYRIGWVIGDFFGKFNIGYAIDSYGITYVNRSDKATVYTGITYRDFWNKYTTVSIAVGNNYAQYTPMRQTDYWSNKTNALDDIKVNFPIL